MLVTFRQGIVKAQRGISGIPSFLLKHDNTGNFVDFDVAPDATIINFAHGSRDYLVEEARPVARAWGPFQFDGSQYFLYWDLDLGTGALTRGATKLQPIVSTTAPLNPQNDQHWFDSDKKQMKVWFGNHWTVKVRVFAAVYNTASPTNPFVYYPIGASQANLNNIEVHVGAVILGSDAKPLRHHDGGFVTTTDELIVGREASHNVKVEAAVVRAKASEMIPKFSLVSYSGPGMIKLGSYADLSTRIHGIVVEELYPDEVGVVITHGKLVNAIWEWPNALIGRSFFCGHSGEIVTTPPSTGISQICGYIVDKDTIYIDIQMPIMLSNPNEA